MQWKKLKGQKNLAICEICAALKADRRSVDLVDQEAYNHDIENIKDSSQLNFVFTKFFYMYIFTRG